MSETEELRDALQRIRIKLDQFSPRDADQAQWVEEVDAIARAALCVVKAPRGTQTAQRCTCGEVAIVGPRTFADSGDTRHRAGLPCFLREARNDPAGTLSVPRSKYEAALRVVEAARQVAAWLEHRREHFTDALAIHLLNALAELDKVVGDG